MHMFSSLVEISTMIFLMLSQVCCVYTKIAVVDAATFLFLTLAPATVMQPSFTWTTGWLLSFFLFFCRDQFCVAVAIALHGNSYCCHTVWQQLLLSHCVVTALLVLPHHYSCYWCCHFPVSFFALLWCYDSATKLLPVVYCQPVLLLLLHVITPALQLCSSCPCNALLECCHLTLRWLLRLIGCAAAGTLAMSGCLWPLLVDCFHSYFICPHAIAGHVDGNSCYNAIFTVPGW